MSATYNFNGNIERKQHSTYKIPDYDITDLEDFISVTQTIDICFNLIKINLNQTVKIIGECLKQSNDKSMY